MPCWHLPADSDRLQGPQPRGGRSCKSSFQVLSTTQSHGLLPLLPDGKPAESSGQGGQYHRIKQRRGLLVGQGLPGPAWPGGCLQGARQLSFGRFCGAAEEQKRNVQEVVGDDGQAAPEKLSEEEDGDEEEGGGGAEAEEEVVEAGASWRRTRSLPSPG